MTLSLTKETLLKNNTVIVHKFTYQQQTGQTFRHVSVNHLVSSAEVRLEQGGNYQYWWSV